MNDLSQTGIEGAGVVLASAGRNSASECNALDEHTDCYPGRTWPLADALNLGLQMAQSCRHHARVRSPLTGAELMSAASSVEPARDPNLTMRPLNRS